MSEAKPLNELMAQLPSVTDATGKSVVLTDAQGTMSKISYASFMRKNLCEAEEAGSTLLLKDFIQKYIQGMPPGFVLTDIDYNNSVRWYLNLKPGLNLSMQNYCILVTKAKGSVNGAWSALSFLVIPTATNDGLYSVCFTTGATSAESSVRVNKIEMTTV